jgi:hypothetical protein
MKTLLIIENNYSLQDCYYVNNFLKTWDWDVIDFTGFTSRKPEEIFAAVTKCTDIISQTALVNGSEVQFERMVGLMGKIKEPKTIHIAFLGGDLFNYIDRYFDDEALAAIAHHKIYEISFDEPEKLLDFSPRVNAYHGRIAAEKHYKDTAKGRTTGKKVLVMACNGNGNAFLNLPFGKIVDELDMQDSDENPNRGVWVWGNGQPIKLVNDCGQQEYKIVSELTTDDKIIEMFKEVGLKLDDFGVLVLAGIKNIINDTELDTMEKANLLCEELTIPKRVNRQKIYGLITK